MVAQGSLPYSYLEAYKDAKRVQNPVSHLFSKYLLTASLPGGTTVEGIGNIQ